VKRLLSVLVTFLLLVPAEVFAKAETSKITIKGGDLRAPIEITNPKTLANFSVWTGLGTSCTGAGCPQTTARQAESFIVDWSQAVADPPSGLQRYEGSFYAKTPNERLIYVVFYEYDPATEHGYIYFPGRTEEWYRLNVRTIFHGVEVRARGDSALRHGLRGRPSNRKTPEAVKERAVELYREKKQAKLWHDYGPTLTVEELAEQHGITISRETLRKWLIEAKLWRVRRARVEQAHVWRARRARLANWCSGTPVNTIGWKGVARSST